MRIIKIKFIMIKSSTIDTVISPIIISNQTKKQNHNLIRDYVVPIVALNAVLRCNKNNSSFVPHTTIGSVIFSECIIID
jgi:hypothetical protein